jgi:hypothetical protein
MWITKFLERRIGMTASILPKACLTGSHIGVEDEWKGLGYCTNQDVGFE